MIAKAQLERVPGPMSASSANAISSTSASSAMFALGQSLSGKVKVVNCLVVVGSDEALRPEDVRGARTRSSRSSKLR